MDIFLGLVFAALPTLGNARTTMSSSTTQFDNCGFNLSATCDDKMTLFADGNLLATSDNWKTTSVVYIPPETQVVEIHCIDGWIHGGILAASDANGLITDGTWSCTSDNGTTWNPAYVLGTNGVTAPDISPLAKWIWTGMNTWTHTHEKRHTTAICKTQLVTTECRPKIPPWCPTTTPPPTGFNLSATCDNEMKLFADGNLLASSDNWEVTSLVSIPADTQILEIHCTDTGILGGILASSDSGLKTDGTWSCSSDNGTTWSPAYEMGLNGAAVPDIDTDANWIWTGCIGDWTGKYTGNNKPKNVICKTILPKTSTSITSAPQFISPTPLVQGIIDGTCYEDDWSRLFDAPRTNSATNTPEECKKTCAGRGYDYAGVQYTVQCFCGNDEPPASRIRDSSECDAKCPGDEAFMCGGSLRMNIYKTDRAGLLDGTCYKDDDPDSRLLPGYLSRSATNTPDECKDICNNEGYSYAGVQWSNECWCGNDEPPASRITDSSQCSLNCPQDASQKCGGSSRMNIYKTGYLNTDNYKDCPEWKHLCTSGDFGDCMNTNCARSCNLAETTTTTTTTTFTAPNLYGSLSYIVTTMELPYSNSTVCAEVYKHRLNFEPVFNLYTDQPLSNLANFGWDDTISSISVKEGSVIEAFEHANFEGEKLEITSHTIWSKKSKYNDWISSLRCYKQTSG